MATMNVDPHPDPPMPRPALTRTARTGIYLVRGISRDLQRAARGRAVREQTTLRAVLASALTEYAAGTWTPEPDGIGTPRPS